jgi:gluconolactonase
LRPSRKPATRQLPVWKELLNSQRRGDYRIGVGRRILVRRFFALRRVRMLRTLSFFGFATWAALAAAADLPAPTGSAIVDPSAKLELLYTRTAPIEGGLTEGPAVAPDGSIYFSDIPMTKGTGLIVRFDPKSKQTAAFTDDSGMSNGLTFDAQGRLLACEGANKGGRCVSRWDVSSKTKTILADGYQGKRFNAPNDNCLDAKGRLYFTDPKYLGAEPRELEKMSVYRLDPATGKVDLVTTEVAKPNGIALSPDGRTMYLADHDNGNDDVTKPPPAKHGAMKIYAFPLDAEGNVAGPRKTIVDFGDKKGCDGMTIDAAGNVYLTVREPTRPGVLVVDPAGTEIAFIPTGPANQTEKPVGLPSNVEFGLGDEANVLYITVDVSLYRIPLRAKGYHVQYATK